MIEDKFKIRLCYYGLILLFAIAAFTGWAENKRWQIRANEEIYTGVKEGRFIVYKNGVWHIHKEYAFILNDWRNLGKREDW